MEIYFFNICIKWLFQLYEEYLYNIKNIIVNDYNIPCKIIIVEEKDYLNEFENIYNKKNKIIFCGSISVINEIIQNYSSNNFYYLNIEQMSHNSYYRLFRTLNKNIKIIDYSEENIPFYKDLYDNIFLLPPYFPKKIDNKKDIEIISFSNNDYRKNILNKINKKFYVKKLDNIFGKERDDIFSRSKIYINIHSSKNHKTMELIRIINLLQNNVIVISQNSVFIDLIHIKDSILIFEDDKQMNYLIDDILHNYDFYYNYLFKNSNMCYYDNYILKKIKNIIND